MDDIRSRIVGLGHTPKAFTDPELGDMYIRRLPIGELNFEQAKKDAEPPMTIRLLARYIGNEDGTQVFDINQKDRVKLAEDLVALKALPVDVVTRILEEGNRVNGIAAVPVGKP